MDEVKPSKPPSRGTIMEIVRRYLKKGVTPVWSREIPVFHTLWKTYPSLPFWTRHELGYRLNSMLHFLTEEGKAKLSSDWTIFHFVYQEPAPISEVTRAGDTKDVTVASSVDKTESSSYNPPTPRPKTTAEFLKG